MTLHGVLVVGALTLGAGAAVSDGVQPVDGARLASHMAGDRDSVSAIDLAEAIAAGHGPAVFDLRSAAEFEQFHVPSATHTTLDALAGLELPRTTRLVLYADGGVRVAQARVLLRMRGYRDVVVLRDGVYEWIARVHEPQLASDATLAERQDFERRAALSRYFGGQPHLDVPRGEVASGYWTTEPRGGRASMNTALLVAAIRRRGC